MRSFIRTQLWPAVAVLLALTLITGFIYPAAVTAVAQVAFPSQANGSQIVADGKTVGSTLIGQTFDDPKYFWGRPSAAGAGYDPTLSGGSNLAPTSQALIDAITARVDALASRQRQRADPGRPGDGLGLRAGPGHQPRGGRVPGAASGRRRAA